MSYQVASASDVGRKRSQNQDSFAVNPELGLFLVADGMGGHRGGETASSMVREIVPAEVRKAVARKDWDPVKTVMEAIQTANSEIYRVSGERSELKGMGTTTTALLFQGPLMTIGHVGDSRCYFLRPDALWQATRDHSLVQEKLRAGLITREEMKTDRMKNVITRSVGFERECPIEIYQMECQVGDVFLLCSDGLSGMIEDTEILRIVQEEFFRSKGDVKRLQAAVDRLIAGANENGGEDNITTVMVQLL